MEFLIIISGLIVGFSAAWIVHLRKQSKLFESTKRGDTIIGRIERIKELGASTTKSLPQALIDRIE
ncbi:MAG: hypothetical protein LBT56_01130 [Prevotellaceae bacterium]|jgi:hypothetical protein|nr:hypothetical protein [Prevotellaceae bacterium]